MRPTALPLALLLLGGLLAPALLAPAAASPQPTPVCPFCGPSFERAADEQGVNATVAESTVEVRVRENGTATWVVRNRLTVGAEQFRADPDRLEATASLLGENAHDPPEDPVLVSARTDGDTAVLTYRDPDGAARRAGLPVVDYFHDGVYDRWYVLNADRFTVSGPAGTVVTNDPESGEVGSLDRGETSHGSVTWRGDATAESWDAPSLDGSPYVVFGPDRSAVTDLRTTLAVALATLPVVVHSIQTFMLYQTAAFAVSLAAVVAVLRRRPPGGDPQQWAPVVALVGALLGVVPAMFVGPRGMLGPPLVAIGLGALAVHPRTRKRFRTPRRQAAAATGVLAAAFVALAGLNFAVADSPLAAVAAGLRFTAVALPVAAMVPLGAALTADGRRLLPWYGLAVVAFAAVPAGLVDLADPPSGMGTGLLALSLFGLAVLAPLLGGAVAALGRSLAD